MMIKELTAAPTPTPISTKRPEIPPRPPARKPTMATMAIAPTKAAPDTGRPRSPKITIATMAHSEAPALTPSTSGLARGLRISRCSSEPPNPKHTPTSTPSTMRAARNSHTIKAAVESGSVTASHRSPKPSWGFTSSREISAPPTARASKIAATLTFLKRTFTATPPVAVALAPPAPAPQLGPPAPQRAPPPAAKLGAPPCRRRSPVWGQLAG